MELFPKLELGWLNGWLPLCLLYLVFGILLLLFPKGVVAKLYDRSGWSRRQKILTAVAKLFVVLPCFALIVFSPLQIGEPAFILGSILYAVGLVGFVAALFNFRNTPVDQPVTRGLYRISRNPQWVTLMVCFLGVCIAIGSWMLVLLLLMAAPLSHFRILAEERSCLQRYGDSYRSYVQRVPRYFLFF